MKVGSEKTFGAGYDAFSLWKKRLDARTLVTTPNSDAIYAMSYVDLGKDGPLEFDAPPMLQQRIPLNFRQRPIPVDGGKFAGAGGFFGPDQGKRGKFLMLPPGYEGEVPEGHFGCRSGTNNVFGFLRAFHADASDLKPLVDVVEKTKIYPLKGQARPMQFPDASGVPANMLPISGATAFEELKKLLDAEGPHLADPDWKGRLAGLGIVQGEPFRPDERPRGILDRAARSAYKMSRVIAFDEVVSGRSLQMDPDLQPAAPGPARPGRRVGSGVPGAVVLPGTRTDLAQRHAQPPGPSAFQHRARQPVHRDGLRHAPAAAAPAHPARLVASRRGVSAQLSCGHVLGLGGQFLASHVVHRLDDHRHDVEAVVADGRRRQCQRGALGVRRAHVHADMPHFSQVFPVGPEVQVEVQRPLMVWAFAGQQQPPGIQIAHDPDAVLATAQAGLVDADGPHTFEALRGMRLIEAALDAPPHRLVIAAQECGGLAKRQLPAQRQGLERCREARARSRPRHTRPGRLAATAAGHARHVGVQPDLELESVQVPPLAEQPVLHWL